MTLDAVVFDLGQVLVRWDPYGPFVGRMDREDVEAFFEDIDFPSFNHHQDAGRPWAQARAEVLARFPQHVAALDLYVHHFADALPGPVPGSERLVRDLLDAGVRALGLTNWSSETFHLAEPAAPAVGLLEDVLVSGSVGLAKPDERIFRMLVDRFDLTPETTLFTDDSPTNIEAAARLGLQTVTFTSAQDLRRELVSRGVALPRT
ncbi:HAD family phosphatase [Cellulomonas sp. URHE0023]|uniref:HAD family hydrolase n=1 Tax=Cellulomonas sp. URHE0023 TaxID=1380354 RepID=UPI0004802F7D|nr:HAD family phosphatase [Cellulomonas sp. URHE0023]